MTERNGYQAMITQHAWMFLSSFEKLRTKLLAVDIVNMAHLGARAFEEIGGEVVQTTSFIIRRTHVTDYTGEYCRLTEPTSQQGKEDMFLSGENRYAAVQSNFSKIPGSPVAYWVSHSLISVFANSHPVSDVSKGKSGQNTGDNNRFLRLWNEVNCSDIGFCLPDGYDGIAYKWIPYNKGGEYRRWYGNYNYVVNWKNDGSDIKAYAVKRNGGKHWSRYIQNLDCLYKEGITWSIITSGMFSMRYLPKGFICDYAGCAIFPNHEINSYLLGLFNTKMVELVLKMINPTINCQPGNVGSVPFVFSPSDKNKVDTTVQHLIEYSKLDWDSYESSWDFKRNPLVNGNRLTIAYAAWRQECEDRFRQLKKNEEELNRIFIDIYGLQDELTPDVADKDVTVHRVFDSKDDVPESMKGSNYVRTMRDEIVSLISYAVGCMFGRYSLDVDGLAYAGGNYDSKYCRWIRQFGDKATEEIDENGNLIHGGWAGCTLWEYDGVRKDGKWIPASFAPDTDNIIPICDDEYFDDDIVGRFVEFVKTVYGEDTLDENLKFIADALGGKGAPKEVIRNYFMNGFYADHCKTYQKRPIYWLFDSGKKNGFKALIYMHRYQPDTIARIRTDYVHEQQARYRTAIADLEQRIANAATGERVKLNKQLKKLNDQAAEILAYEEKIHHLADQMIPIDLDDGVKVNYAKFQDVLAKIK